ncbi:hydrolase [Pseudomonas fulva]|nr:hydrolase [Pseudomonas fulva]MBF8778760.1 hydrolase [Pseudomonas fulva]
MPFDFTPLRPATALGNPHLQTLWGPLFRRQAQPERDRERFWLADGDFLDLDWHGPHLSDTPLVLILHGLTGSSRSPYVIGLQQALATMGWASVAVNWRGCSGEPNLLPRSYHSGISEDLAEVIAYLRGRRPLAPLHAVGYSLGGNVLLKYLGETGRHSQLQAAVAVSVPFRLDQCADRMALGFSRLYQAHFMRELATHLQAKRQHLRDLGHADALATLERLGPLGRLRTFWDFDGKVTAPLNGFEDAQDYYRRASSRYYLGANRTPTLIIQSSDDPFIFRHSLPTAGELAADTWFELHDKGGHVGFVEGSLRRPRYYLERRIPQWLQERT